MKINRTILLIAVLSLIMASNACAQIVFGQRPNTSPQFVYSSWTLTAPTGEEAKISQSYVPVTGFVPISDNLEAQVYLASSSSSVESPIGDPSASGLTDIRLQLNKSLSDDRILISGGLNLPLGKTELNFAEEYGVVPALSHDFLDFPLRRFGEGLGFNLLVGGATMAGEARLGGGILYQFKGEYTPYEGSDGYNPGDLVTINAGGELPRGNMTWAANVVYTTYFTDKLDGAKTFKQSQQFALGFSGHYSQDSYTLRGFVNWIGRGKNTIYDTTETVFSENKLYGDEFSFGADATVKLGNSWSVSPLAKLRLIAENDIALGSADILTLGGALGKQLAEEISANAGFKYFTGSAPGFKYFTGSADGDSIDLSGYQFSIGLLATF